MKKLLILLAFILVSCGGGEPDKEHCYFLNGKEICCKTYCDSEGKSCRTYCNN